MYDARVYTYDSNSRLKTANYPGVGKYNYVYDWVGNRLNPGGATYNAADQLVTRFVHTYTYDGAGNLTQDNNIVYAYTPANLLQSVTNGSAVSSMTWDASGNRVSFTSSTDTQNPYYFVYDTTAGIPAVVEEVTPTGSVYYVREPNGALIARISGTSTCYYHFNNLGSILFLTDGSGTLTDKYAYNAWGKTTHEGTTTQPYQYVGQLGYYTHYQDENMDGLLQLGVRFYDPSVGRFTQRDPAQDGLNWYIYVGDRPTASVDPTGQKCTPIGLPEPVDEPGYYAIKITSVHSWRRKRTEFLPRQMICQCYWESTGYTEIRESRVLYERQKVSCMTKNKCGNWYRWYDYEYNYRTIRWSTGRTWPELRHQTAVTTGPAIMTGQGQACMCKRPTW